MWQREAFQAMLRPHMLRRLKSDVLKDLPEKREVVVPVPLSSLQVHYYQEVLARNYEMLHRNVKGSQRVGLLNTVMQLRKVRVPVCVCVGERASQHSPPTRPWALRCATIPSSSTALRRTRSGMRASPSASTPPSWTSASTNC